MVGGSLTYSGGFSDSRQRKGIVAWTANSLVRSERLRVQSDITPAAASRAVSFDQPRFSSACTPVEAILHACRASDCDDYSIPSHLVLDVWNFLFASNDSCLPLLCRNQE
jgi:hypothetical protein